MPVTTGFVDNSAPKVTAAWLNSVANLLNALEEMVGADHATLATVAGNYISKQIINGGNDILIGTSDNTPGILTTAGAPNPGVLTFDGTSISWQTNAAEGGGGGGPTGVLSAVFEYDEETGIWMPNGSNIIDGSEFHLLPWSKDAADWTADNDLLGLGEVGYESDTGLWKRGDGSTLWNALAYQGSGGSGTDIDDWADVAALPDFPATFPPTIGSTSTTAVAGNDTRLTNERVPTDGSVTVTKVDPATLVTSGEGIGANNNNTTWATCAAIIAYVSSLVAAGDGGLVDTIVPGANIDVDVTDPANPVVSVENLTHDDITDFTTSVNALISTAVNNLVASAPGTLDTLDEIATALGDDPNFATTITGLINAKQTGSAKLDAIVALTWANNKLMYMTGTGAVATTDFTSQARTFLAAANVAAQQAALSLTPGTDVQAYSSQLATLAGLSSATDNFIVGVAGAWAARTVAQVKTTLGLNNVENTALSTAIATERSAARTLTNARVTDRVETIASSATPTLATDSYDAGKITALAANITGITFSGTPTDFQDYTLRVKCDATPRSFVIGSGGRNLVNFSSFTASKTTYLGFRYNADDAVWDLVAARTQP